jgi:hypothetical protein
VKRTLLLLLALPSCLSPSGTVSFAPPAITGGSPDGVDILAVAPVSTEGLSLALAGAGFGLRVAGERGDLRLRALAPPPTGREGLAAACGVQPWQFSAPVAFRPGDELSVSALAPDLPVRGFTLILRARGDPGRVEALDVAAVARPADGSLLPVIRGEVPVSGPGPVLITGDRDGRLVFAALLLLETGGQAASAPTREHLLVLHAFLVPTEELAGLLPGGDSGTGEPFEARRVPAAAAAGLPAALAVAGRTFPPEERRFTPGTPVTFAVSGVALSIREDFRLADYGYLSRLEFPNRPETRALELSHGERDTVLLLGRDAHAPGTSFVALIRSRPVSEDDR